MNAVACKRSARAKAAAPLSTKVSSMRIRPLAALIAGAALLLPATAAADVQTLFDDYRADNVIDGCAQSPAELSAALGEIPADVRVYDPGFADALNAALEQAATVCRTAPRQAVAQLENQLIAEDGSPGPAVPERGALMVPETDRDMPPVLVGLSALLLAALAAAALLGLSHRYGWDLRGRLAPAGAAMRSAERRLGDGLRSLLDRLGF
jgi:hypothetical protein